jgi:hypothetical protein
VYLKATGENLEKVRKVKLEAEIFRKLKKEIRQKNQKIL